MTCLSHMHGDSDQETLDQADCKPLSVQQSEKQREARGSHSTKKRNDSRQESNEFRIQMS